MQSSLMVPWSGTYLLYTPCILRFTLSKESKNLRKKHVSLFIDEKLELIKKLGASTSVARLYRVTMLKVNGFELIQNLAYFYQNMLQILNYLSISVEKRITAAKHKF